MGGKFDSFGRSLMAVREKERAEELEEKMMLKDIEKRVINAKESNTLPHSRFHIMSITTWTKTAPITEYDGPNEPGIEGEIIPAEIGLVEMNLRDGLISRCYQMVHPGPLPLGYKGDMMARSEKTHQIWLDNPCLSEDYDTIIGSIHTLLKLKTSKEHYAGFDCNALDEFENLNVDGSHIPHSLTSAKNFGLLPIYVMPEQKKTCRKALEWLKKKANVDYSFCIYNLPQLLLHLVKHAPLAAEVDNSNFTSSMFEANLRRDVFLYVPGVGCSYHDKRQNCQCAGGAASRLGYIVCDFACKLYNIKVLEGYHLPSGVIIRANNALESQTIMDDVIGSRQADSITDASWDNNSDAISIPNNGSGKNFDTTMMSQISSCENPYKELIEDAHISGLGFGGKSRHALAIDPQEVTEHILAPLFSNSRGNLCSKDLSTTENDSKYYSFISSAKVNSTTNSVSKEKEDKLLRSEISKDKPYCFRSLRELTLKSDFRVHPPPCHKQFLIALKAEKKTSILENKELGPPVAKSAYLTEKIKMKEFRAKK